MPWKERPIIPKNCASVRPDSALKPPASPALQNSASSKTRDGFSDHLKYTRVQKFPLLLPQSVRVPAVTRSSILKIAGIHTSAQAPSHHQSAGPRRKYQVATPDSMSQYLKGARAVAATSSPIKASPFPGNLGPNPFDWTPSVRHRPSSAHAVGGRTSWHARLLYYRICRYAAA
jgi:hypothetical protein